MKNLVFKKISFVFVLLISFLLVACGDDPKEDPTIELTGDTIVEVGSSITLTAKSSDNTLDFKWSTSDESILTVDNGVVTGVKAGKATISVVLTSNEKVTSKIEITVKEKKIEPIVYVISLSKKEVTLEVGTEEVVTATVTPDTTLKWNSEDETIATVKDGKITAIKAGTTNVLVKTNDDSKTETIKVVVNEKPVEKYTVEDLKIDLSALLTSYKSALNGSVTMKISSEDLLSATYVLDSETVFSLVFNYTSDNKIESFAYVMDGNVDAHIYVKDGSVYKMLDSLKTKSTLTDDEASLIIKDYGFETFVGKAVSFYDEGAFYDALELVSEEDDKVSFKLNLEKYTGAAFNVAGKSSILISITRADNTITSISVDSFTDNICNTVIIEYNGAGTTKQAITYPTDLDTYQED